MGLLFLQYFGLSFLVVFSSIRISECVDELDKRTNLGGALIGGILLAGVTSLPELITSLSSTLYLNNPDLALGNILGSNAFNVFILAVGNVFFLKHMMFNHTTRINAKTNLINVMIYIIILFTFFSVTNAHIAHVGVSSILIFILYYINLKVATGDSNEETEANDLINGKGTLAWLILRFVFWGGLIVLASLLVSITTDKIAQATGIGSSFVGAIFLGIATSLPETTSLISLVRLRNYDMAVGNIVGSNLFNFGVIALTDLLYFSGNIFEIADTSNSLLVTVGLCEGVILLFILLRRRVTNLFLYVLPSLIIMLIYSYYIAISLK
ncbi:MAG: sodium:calcium antiporter [Turicibacter sp.]